MPYIPKEARAEVITNRRAKTRGELNYLLSYAVHEHVLKVGLSYDAIVFVEKAIHRTVEKCLGLKQVKKENELTLKLFNILILNRHIDEEDRLITLGLVGAEFYRTVAAPYEDKKRKENGSVSSLDEIFIFDFTVGKGDEVKK